MKSAGCWNVTINLDLFLPLQQVNIPQAQLQSALGRKTDSGYAQTSGGQDSDHVVDSDNGGDTCGDDSLGRISRQLIPSHDHVEVNWPKDEATLPCSTPHLTPTKDGATVPHVQSQPTIRQCKHRRVAAQQMVSLKMIRVKVVGVAVLETGPQLQFLCFN